MSDISLRDALTQARQSTVAALVSAVEEEGFIGITGAPQVGKTTLMETALAQLEHAGTTVVRVDVTGAYSAAKLRARWLHAILRALTGPVAASHAAGLPQHMWPGTTRTALLQAREFLGDDYHAALHGQPRERGRIKDFSDVIDLTSRLARDGRCVLVLDHVDAPLLTAKHPVDPRDLLWQIRACAQHLSHLAVVALCAPVSVDDVVAGLENAYYGDGRWLTLSPPSADEWGSAARRAQSRVDEPLLALAEGHVPTALLMARLVAVHGLESRQAFTVAATAQYEHAARAIMHATSLHPMGGHVLIAIANGDGPYSSTPEARSDQVARVVQQLARAGLIRRPFGDNGSAGRWQVADPLIRWTLAEPMNRREIEPVWE